MFANEPGLEVERDPTGKLVEVQRQSPDGLAVRAVAACAFLAALFALIGETIERVLVL
jgi:hypothetical protein